MRVSLIFCLSAVDGILKKEQDNPSIGDGRGINLAFSREDDCQIVHIRNSGSGLGLYICRTLMRKMNGDIFAEIQGNDMVVTAVFAVA